MTDPDLQIQTAKARFFVDHGWLAAVLPAEASRFRVLDPDVAYTVRGGGGQLVERDPDVEIGPVSELSGEAPVAVVSLDASRPDHGRPSDAARRIGASATVRVAAQRTRRELRRRGYRSVSLLLWERDEGLRIPGLTSPSSRQLSDRFPRRALVVGSRREPRQTAFERAISEAGEIAGRRLAPSWPLVRVGCLVAICDGAILRVATAGATEHVRAQTGSLQALGDAPLSALVAARVPRLLGQGEFVATRWLLESRLPGRPAPRSLSSSLLADCIDFLAELHGLGTDREGESASVWAATLEPVIPPSRRPVLRRLTERLDAELAAVPRGFGHGDFCSHNLLVSDGRLAGVVDWEAASRSSLPLVDLLHLTLTASSPPDIYRWGPALIHHLLPVPKSGGGPVIRGYLERIALDLDRPTLEALVAAYWLRRASYQLGTYIERSRDRLWIERNVVGVLDAFGGAE